MRARVSLVFSVLVSLSLILGGYLISAQRVSAVGSAADLMCAACQMDPTKPMFCPTVFCQDLTSGFSTPGHCVTPGVCLATATGGGSITQISQLLGAVGQILGMLKGGGGGDSGGSGSGSGSGCTTYTQTSDPNNANPCAYYVPGSGTTSQQCPAGTTWQQACPALASTCQAGGSCSNNATSCTWGCYSSQTPAQGSSSAANDLISSLIGSGSGNSNSNSNSNTSSSTSNTSSGSVIPSSASVLASVTGITNPQNLTPGTSAAVSQSAFGNAPGITGDIQVLSGSRVTILASSRDITGNKQTSGFYGFGTTVGESTADVYTQICASRPWATNFLSFVISASYYDNLCTSHGYAVGPPQLQPASPPPAPPSPPSSQATSTPQYLGPMSADIWASPSSVSSGSRTSIFWSAKGVLSCVISNDSGPMASALSGNASTLPLTKTATFSIACQSATSTVSNQVVVTVQ